MVLGEMDVALVNIYRSGKGEPPVHLAWLIPLRPAAVTRSGGDERSASFSVRGWRPQCPDNHPYGVGGWEMAYGEDSRDSFDLGIIPLIFFFAIRNLGFLIRGCYLFVFLLCFSVLTIVGCIFFFDTLGLTFEFCFRLKCSFTLVKQSVTSCLLLT